MLHWNEWDPTNSYWGNKSNVQVHAQYTVHIHIATVDGQSVIGSPVRTTIERVFWHLLLFDCRFGFLWLQSDAMVKTRWIFLHHRSFSISWTSTIVAIVCFSWLQWNSVYSVWITHTLEITFFLWKLLENLWCFHCDGQLMCSIDK